MNHEDVPITVGGSSVAVAFDGQEGFLYFTGKKNYKHDGNRRQQLIKEKASEDHREVKKT